MREKELKAVKKYSDIILSEITKRYKQYKNKLDKENIKLGEYGNCDGTSRYWKMLANIDHYAKVTEDMLEEMNDLDEMTNWYELRFQERYNFIGKSLLETYELIYIKGGELNEIQSWR